MNIYYIEVNYTGTTGIDNAAATATGDNAPVYDMSGRRTNKDAKGILIMNGKKFVNK